MVFAKSAGKCVDLVTEDRSVAQRLQDMRRKESMDREDEQQQQQKQQQEPEQLRQKGEDCRRRRSILKKIKDWAAEKPEIVEAIKNDKIADVHHSAGGAAAFGGVH